MRLVHVSLLVYGLRPGTSFYVLDRAQSKFSMTLSCVTFFACTLAIPLAKHNDGPRLLRDREPNFYFIGRTTNL